MSEPAVPAMSAAPVPAREVNATPAPAGPPRPAADAATINLTLASHTNVGKTTLLRTLLRQDIGEVADRPHVTDEAADHVLIATGAGDTLRLWDTPGFGDSARLLKRLRMSDNPLGWLATQVWDRFTDRPFFSSQQAIRNVREESDVVLYLVNAAEDPASAGYVELELQILGWVGKPVLLLLNQLGAPREREVEAADERAWRRHVAPHAIVRGVLGLDAFARCWVQEDQLLGAVSPLLPPASQHAFGRLRAAWREKNLEVFATAMRVLAVQLGAVAADRETVGVPSLGQKTDRWLKSVLTERASADPDAERAMNALGNRLGGAVREATDQLIALHGLSGRAGEVILARASGQFAVDKPADAGTTGVIGGVVSGVLGGLAADLAVGGLSFGAGALIGGILGALGAGGAAKAYNLARGAADGKAGWSLEFLAQRPAVALLRYLAVAHYGRGRGDWVEGEYPPHWQQVVDDAAAGHRDEIIAAMRAAEHGAGAGAIAERLEPLLAAMASETLVRLYPEAAPIFDPTERTAP